MDLIDAIKSIDKSHEDDILHRLYTPWGENLDKENVLPEYPRPQLQRSSFFNLNGMWSYAFTQSSSFPTHNQGQILVPFSPESILSGVERRLEPSDFLWYKRSLPEIKIPAKKSRLILHFGAVDQSCKIYVNGEFVKKHVGGFLPISVDITNKIKTDGEKLLPDNEIMVCVQDSTDTSWHSRGKQKLKRGGMYYTAQSGIWQTVWLEWVPDTYITNLKIIPQKDLKTVKIYVKTNGKCNVVLDILDAICNTKEPELFEKTFREAFVAEPGKKSLSSPAPYKIVSKAEHHSEDMKYFTTTFTCKITNPKLWSPEKPFLYGLIVRAGLDIITSYFGMRCFTIDRDKYGYNTFCLNHKPYFLNGVLDQGYWPDGLYTAPSDEAFIFDIRAMKKHGFNMLRKHIKIEAARYYYHCDRIGMIVWQDMVSGGYDYSKPLVSYLPTLFPKVFSSMPDGPESYRMFRRESAEGRKEWTEEMIATIKLLINCPCISTWVLFNEGWGQFNAAAATIIAGKVDPSRLIDQASGWFDEHSGDFLSVHNYFRPLSPARDKFGRAYVISEYGGLATHIDGHSSVDRIYGYKKYETKKEFKAAYNNLINNTLMPLAKKGLSGAVYTQLSDVEEEVNGILTYDRKIDKLE